MTKVRMALIERIESKFDNTTSSYFSNDVAILLRDVGKSRLNKLEKEKILEIKSFFNYDSNISAFNALRELYYLLQS